MRIKEAIINLQNAMIPVENVVVLDQARIQTDRLRQKLLEFTNQAELDAFDAILIGKIKTSVFDLHVSLEGMNDADDRAQTIRMINRLRRDLLQRTNWQVLAELDVRLYTVGNSGIA